MTIKELYEWAIENGVEDYDIEIKYGGLHHGHGNLCCEDIEVDYIRFEVVL